MMCLIPSCFDVAYHSLLVSRGGGITFEQFRESKKSGKKKTRMNWCTSSPFSCAVSMLPHDQCAAFLKPLLSYDCAADVISRNAPRALSAPLTLHRRHFSSILFQRSGNYSFLRDAVYLCLFGGFPLSTYTCTWEKSMSVFLMEITILYLNLKICIRCHSQRQDVCILYMPH